MMDLWTLTTLLTVLLLAALSVSVEGRWTPSQEQRRGTEEDRRMGRRSRRSRAGEMERLLQKAVDAVQLGVDFFASDYSNINLDGLFGIRLGQGQIMEAEKECSASGSCPEALQIRLQALSDQIDVTGTKAIRYVENQDEAYFQQFLPMVSSPYIVRYRPVHWTTDQHSARWPLGHVAGGVVPQRLYNETAGDLCFSRIAGTWVQADGKKGARCDSPQSCWTMMTKPNQGGYSITHQLLYFILIEKTGCEKEMHSDVRKAETDLCRSIFTQASREVHKGTVPEFLQDLFLEQVVLCGILGFENFLRTDWMKMVMSWQRPSGCFSTEAEADMFENLDLDKPKAKAKVAEEEKEEEEKEEEKERKEEEEVKEREEEEEERLVWKDLQREAQMIESRYHGRNGRKLLRENVMEDGCLAHKSGLGFSTLCLYVRYLVRQVYLN